MKILDRYILKSFIVTFLTVFVILFLIFILQTVWLFIGELTGKDLDVTLIFKFLLFKMPSIVPLVLPLSIVLASIMTFGSFAENYEFAAMKSAGISLKRAMRGLSIFILLLSLASFAFANNVIPYAEYKFINFRKNIAQLKPAMAIAEGQFSEVGLYNIKVDKKSGKNGNLLSEVTIHKKSAGNVGKNNTVIKARSGELLSNEDSNILQLVLKNGFYYEDIIPKKFEERNKMPFAKSSFKRYVINIDLSKLNKADLNDEAITNTNTMLNVGELSYTIDSLNNNYNKEILSFSDNIYQRVISVPEEIARLPRQPSSAGRPRENLLTLFTPEEQVNILRVATSNVSNTNFAIDSSRLDLEEDQKNINNHYIALYDKFVIAFSCFLMFFIGAPLGAIIRKGGLGLPIVFAILVFIIFHFANTFGKKLAQENGITPFLGTWMSTIILAPLAIMLTYRATNDMSISINFDWLTGFFSKLFPKKDQHVIATDAGLVDIDTIEVAQDDHWNKLTSLTDDALISIVKNSKQFNYSQQDRIIALKILDARGISQEDLLEGNNLFNSEYNRLAAAEERYKLFSNIAATCFVLSIPIAFLLNNPKLAVVIVGALNVAVFYYSIFKSYESHSEMERILNRNIGVNLWIALGLGYPFYILIYFYNKSAVKEAVAQFR